MKKGGRSKKKAIKEIVIHRVKGGDLRSERSLTEKTGVFRNYVC